jgi:hypothetical protein
MHHLTACSRRSVLLWFVMLLPFQPLLARLRLKEIVSASSANLHGMSVLLLYCKLNVQHWIFKTNRATKQLNKATKAIDGYKLPKLLNRSQLAFTLGMTLFPGYAALGGKFMNVLRMNILTVSEFLNSRKHPVLIVLCTNIRLNYSNQATSYAGHHSPVLTMSEFWLCIIVCIYFCHPKSW